MSDSPPPPPEGTVPPPPPPPGTPPPPPEPPAEPPSGTLSTPPEPYPVNVKIEYQDRELNRTTTFFRVFMIIPIAIIITLLAGTTSSDSGAAVGAAGGVIAFPTALMIIFREKYPRWWFDFNKQLTAFLLRFGVYLLLIEDRYPSTDEPQGVDLTLEYPSVTADLNRFMPLIKWLLAFPHYIVLFFLWIGVFFGTIYAWFMILFTGRYPRDLFEFVEGVIRWNTRVTGYTSLLVTDEYPPFRLSP